jgi:hypothetical protein
VPRDQPKSNIEVFDPLDPEFKKAKGKSEAEEIRNEKLDQIKEEIRQF